MRCVGVGRGREKREEGLCGCVVACVVEWMCVLWCVCVVV